jgi:eukaryotic-like serine/threonine-protein kinase
MTSAMTELLGGRYRLVERLGAGGMSVVWRGYDEVLGRQVAVKVLAARLAGGRAFRHRIRTEAQAAARLLHPNITNVYDYGEEDAVPYVVMELVDGQSLAERLGRDEALPWPEAVTACRQVADALATAHARGVVHRDVTPGNVMLTATGAKVVDFGISALVGDRDIDADGSLLGTPAYLAPERLDGGQVSAAADVYALGLLLYRCVAGALPWPASSRTEILRAHLYQEPRPLPPVDGLPAEVVTLTERCLAKAPADRPTSAEVAATLARYATATVVPTRAPKHLDVGAAGTTILPWSTATDALPWAGRAKVAPAVTPLPAARRRFGVAAAAAVAVALLGVTGAVWATSGDPSSEGTLAAGPNPAGAAPTIECDVHYRVTKDTGKAFNAQLTVVNAGKAAVDGWALSFDFPGDQKVRTVAGRVAQAGTAVTVRGAAVLAPGKSTAIGLSGGYGTSNAFPLDFALDGTDCRPYVSGVAGTPTTPAVKKPAPAVERPAPAAKPKPKPKPKPKEDNSGPGGGGSGKGGKGKGGEDD